MKAVDRQHEAGRRTSRWTIAMAIAVIAVIVALGVSAILDVPGAERTWVMFLMPMGIIAEVIAWVWILSRSG